ncbi:MAG: DUF1998 domain-containing protein, partial [Dehalococcoidia bacterium]|nr:DUF1998 domain-containing protein [Dehalococcoidia bacterium]
ALPSADDRQHILLYEAAEGGAGVLRRLVEDAATVPAIARLALEIVHFDSDSGRDRRHPRGAREDCEAACYDCLLSYFNQRDHRLLDRQLLPDLLRAWTQATVRTSPAPVPRDNHLLRLLNLCQPELERTWIRKLDQAGLRLPTDAQRLVEGCRVRPDFLYQEDGVAIFIDGPPHDTPEQRAKDEQQTDALEDQGFTVIRFGHGEDWELILERYPTLFGKPAVPTNQSTATPSHDELDPDDFAAEWRVIVERLVSVHGVAVEPGNEVIEDGRVLDLDLATVRKGDIVLRLVDDGRLTADSVADALARQGHRVVRVSATETDVVKRILSAFEE